MLYARLGAKLRTYATELNPTGSFFYGTAEDFKLFAVNAALPLIYMAPVVDTAGSNGLTSVFLDFAFLDKNTSTGAGLDDQDASANSMWTLANQLHQLLLEDEDFGQIKVAPRRAEHKITESVLSGVGMNITADYSLNLCS